MSITGNVNPVTCFEYTASYGVATNLPIKIEHFHEDGVDRISFAITPLTDTRLVVTVSQDLGNTGTVNTLSWALNSAGNGQTITFDPLITSVIVKGTLPPLANGARIQGGTCANPITLDGSDPVAPAVGLTLSGNNVLSGLHVQGFRSKQLNIVGTGNRLNCVNISRN